MIILGNLLSLFGSICSLISTRAKTYKKTLLIQSLDATFFTLSCLCLGGYSGVAVNSCAIIRNLSCALFKINNFVKIALIIITFTLSCIFRDNAIYGWLPIIASTYYAIVMLNTQDIKKLKISLIINNALWMIYGIIILDFVGVGFKIISIISCTQSLFRIKGGNEDGLQLGNGKT